MAKLYESDLSFAPERSSTLKCRPPILIGKVIPWLQRPDGYQLSGHRGWNKFCICGGALKWIDSHLTDRSYTICVGSFVSSKCIDIVSIPQRSVLAQFCQHVACYQVSACLSINMPMTPSCTLRCCLRLMWAWIAWLNEHPLYNIGFGWPNCSESR